MFDGVGCAWTPDSVECWGSSKASDIAEGAPAADQIVSMAMVADAQCLLDARGDVSCWGDDSPSGPTAGQGDFVRIALSSEYGCGITKNDVVCWSH